MAQNETAPALTLKSFMNKDEVKRKFQEMLGNRATSYITSVLQIAASNDKLAKAEPMSIYNAACTAATLDLPINNNLGFAYIIPYKTKVEELYTNDKGKEVIRQTEKYVAQFQLGYKGVKQLALRTGQFKTIHSTEVRKGELKKHDRLTGELEFDWMQDDEQRLKEPIIGYVSYFELLNGFKSPFYMTSAELKAHGLKYSQTFKQDHGLWKDDNHSMCMKTVTKLNLSKNAPLSVDVQSSKLQLGLNADQAIIKDENATVFEYVDNPITEAVIMDEEKTGAEKKAELKGKKEAGTQGTIVLP